LFPVKNAPAAMQCWMLRHSCISGKPLDPSRFGKSAREKRPEYKIEAFSSREPEIAIIMN
jgi:hypothetical protein